MKGNLLFINLTLEYIDTHFEIEINSKNFVVTLSSSIRLILIKYRRIYKNQDCFI